MVANMKEENKSNWFLYCIYHSENTPQCEYLTSLQQAWGGIVFFYYAKITSDLHVHTKIYSLSCKVLEQYNK